MDGVIVQVKVCLWDVGEARWVSMGYGWGRGMLQGSGCLDGGRECLMRYE